jgi:hypothetical protein
MNAANRIVDLLSILLSREARDRAPARTARVLGRHIDGTERLQRTDALCFTRGAPDSHYTGTILLNPSLAAFHRAGVTGIGTSHTIPAGTLWIETLDPSEYHPGQTYQVTVTGRGFDDTVQIDFLDPSLAIYGTAEIPLNPDLEVQPIHLIDPETLLLDLVVAPGARLLANAPIAFGRPGRARNRKPDAYAITASSVRPRYYAFLDPDDFVASIYNSDGTWFADRGAIGLPAELPTAENGTLIHQDARGAVGPGTLAWRSADNEITVWDVDAAQLYTYQAPAPDIAYCSPPAYHDGQLWWVEFPDQSEAGPTAGQATFTLRNALCDLTAPQTIATVVFAAVIQSWDLGPQAKVASSPTGLLFETGWRDNINHEIDGPAGASFLFGPTGATAQSGAAIDLAQGFAASDGGSVGLTRPTNTLQALPPILGAPTVARWPTTGTWALAEGFGTTFNAAVSADGTTALLYGYPPGGETPIVIEAPSTATTGEPTIRATVAIHPIHGFPPTLLFLMA